MILNGCSVRRKRRTRKTTAADDIQHPATLHASLSGILPSNSAIIGYATDRTLFISAHLSTEIFSVTLSAVIFVPTVTMEAHLTRRRSTHVNIGCFCYGLKNKINIFNYKKKRKKRGGGVRGGRVLSRLERFRCYI